MNYLKKVQKFHHPPDRSIITKDLEGEIDYIDSFKINWQNSSNYSFNGGALFFLSGLGLGAFKIT